MPEIPSTEPELIPTGKVAGGLEPKVAAGLACVFPILGGVIFLVIEKRNKFVRFWAIQSLLLGLLAFAVGIIFFVAHFVLGHLPLIGTLMSWILGFLYHWVFRIAWVVVYIISIVKAFSNQEWEIPILGKIARQWLAKMDSRNLPAA